MRTKSFLRNSIYTILLHFIIIVSGLILPRVILTFYNSEVNGLVLSITQIISYLSLLEFGISAAAVFSLYKPISDSDTEKINRILSSTRRYYLKISIVYIMFVVIMGFFYPIFVVSNYFTKNEIFSLVLVIGFTGAINMYGFSKFRVFLTAAQEIHVLSLASIIQIILNILIIFLLASLNFSIILVKTIAVISVLIRTFILSLYTKKKHAELRFNYKENIKIENKGSAFYLQFAGLLQSGFPILLITFVLDLNSVSIYSIYNMVFISISGLLTVYTTALSSSFGNLIVEGDNIKIKRAYSEFELLYYILFTVVLCTTSSLYLPFIRLYTEGVNDINYLFPRIVTLFTILSIVTNIKVPQTMMIISAGHFLQTRVRVTIQSIILLVMSSVLVFILGIEGILVALIFSHLYRVIDTIFYVPKKITKTEVVQTVYRIFRTLAIVLIFILISGFFDSKIVTTFDWIITAVLVSLISFIIATTLSFVFDHTVFLGVLSRLKFLFRSFQTKR